MTVRRTVNFNHDWNFIQESLSQTKAKHKKGKPVTLPHTWNALDGQDGGNDYHRGMCWYAKRFTRPEGERVFIEFQGVNSTAQVYINDQLIKKHDGGYSTFRVDITEQLQDENLLCVSVDNSPNERVYPQFADFTFYGGIYRDVNLISVSDSHFDLEDVGSSGLYVTTLLDGKDARVHVEVKLTRPKSGQEIHLQVTDKNGHIVAEKIHNTEMPVFELTIPGAHLWNGVEDPYLYTAQASLLSSSTLLDNVTTTFGVREFSINPDQGFILNERSYPLRGVSRHQDRFGKGNALSREDHEEDVRLITEMGATFVRLAHYQHDQYFYDLCDRYGLVVWAEIPPLSRNT